MTDTVALLAWALLIHVAMDLIEDAVDLFVRLRDKPVERKPYRSNTNETKKQRGMYEKHIGRFE